MTTRPHILLRSEAIRRLEQAWIARLAPGELMQRAAAAVAQAAARIARDLPRATPIVALVGPGNNGGDALLAASMLAHAGFPVHALSLGTEAPEAADAAAVWQRWSAGGGTLAGLDALGPLLAHRPLVIDGLFGIGLTRPLAGAAAQAIAAVADARCPVAAVDVPSGIDADRGCVVGGRDGVAIRALVTVTMIADKPGLHTGAVLDHAGRVEVADLGIDATDHSRAAPAGADSGLAAAGTLFGAADASALLAVRARDTHKGSYGAVSAIGGATGTVGAVLLAARGAQAAGAGKVFVVSPDAPPFDAGQPQLMTRSIERALDGVQAACVGCGLGLDERARRTVGRALRAPIALSIDADALSLIACEPSLARALRARRAPTVLTPHPLEAARLLGRASTEVQADRLGAAHELAAGLRVVVVLKGAGTVIAAPDGQWSIVDSGSSALATAGSGDVLAGCIAALLAQGRDPAQAATLGAWLHGRAGDLWQGRHPRGIGLSAAEIPDLLVEAFDTR